MTTQTVNVNPELVLAAARMAKPNFKWRVEERVGLNEIYKVVVSPAPKKPRICDQPLYDEFFRPCDFAEDAHSLMLALMDEKWDFTKSNKRYVATNRTLKYDLQKDESFSLLLLRCVSAQTGIPLS